MSTRDEPATLSAGEVVAGRFQVRRFIARGGMGEVYEAHDLELGSPVALKILRPDLAGDRAALDRLRREIHLARQVTHRGVCRIYDLFHHPTPGPGDRGDLVGFSMELLEGDTLAERLARHGPLPLDRALDAAAQIGDALQAAHAAGVVHRDLKSSNVLLVPGEPTERVVITDFGLARAVDEGPDLANLSSGDSVVGTLAYMAPEQLEGEEATAAADIYAFGTILYEVVSGRRPFAGRTAISNAVRRLSEAPPSPRLHVPSLPARWERAILRCLERRPSRRFASASDVVAALQEARTARTWTRPVVLGLAAVVVAGLVVTAGLQRWPGREPPAGAARAGAAARPTVAVLGFRNLSGHADAEWLGTALSEMLLTELATGNALRTVPGHTVARTTVRLELPPAGGFASDTLARLRRLLDADLVVLGSYLLAPDGRLRLDVYVQDALTGETVATVSDTREEEQLLALVADAGRRLRATLGAGGLDLEAGSVLQTSLSGDPEVTRLYAQGLDRLRRFDAQAAVSLLRRAGDRAPDSSLIHSALARAFLRLGAEQQAAEAGRRAWELARSLPEESRLLVEGQYREITGDWEQAIRIYHRLHDARPDELEVGLRLVRALTEGGQAAEALVTLASLGDPEADPRLALAEAGAAGALSDFRRQLAAAERAIRTAEELDAPLLVAEGRREEAWAAWRLGQPERATSALRQARTLYESAGDQAGVASCLRLTAGVLHDQGRYTEAREHAELALATYRSVGSRAGAASCLATLADVLSSQEEYNGAAALYWQAHEIFDELGDLAGVSQCLNNLAIIRWEEGSFDSALELYEASLDISRRLGDRSGVATCLNNIAVVLHDRGELAAAGRRYEEALLISREIGEPDGVATALNNLGELLRQQGDLEGARARYEESLALRRTTDDLEGIETGLFNIAEVLLEQGHLGAAERRYLESVDLCRQLGSGEDLALSWTRLAQVELDRGRPAAAAEHLEKAAEQASAGATRATLAVVAHGRGDVRHAAGDLAEAHRLHLRAAGLFRDHGDRAGEAEAILAAAADLVEAGDPAAATAAAQRAATVFRALGNHDREAQARAVIARAAAALGQHDRARTMAEMALHRLDASQSCRAGFWILTHLAAVPGAGQLQPRLDAAVDRARSLGCVRAELCLRLAAIVHGDPEGRPGSRPELEAVRDDARRCGLVRIAARCDGLIGR